ncbi:MAG: T9SS type A sorting domain-containing protein [Candidatus Marinimicrobia bacterium]|jgi:hypothetical protein|nr:T9SS type A sorting domain-containing protein [Candidatus Neomarinimicrobiota bacterium]MBT3500781.1 T9SS type A sorting domain-containing protein [Candidatus Neomarinimicrobiota bacterium]MBT3839968.1 T9SS type A sorting domain-containing protein [Candidatus Neomarinimicrobiota bacterium]MBT3998321.1 T9SS type A sorting domain-containing protein [Candidatus Neomarinimicrobiota bacterium]MBT4282399.1 T9SS type A sorting domain-containing protein [Candidatus Neomarinimicrobiota bacterium]
MNIKVLFPIALLLPFLIYSQTTNPIGELDLANWSGGYGWAYDEDAGTDPIEVHIYLNMQFHESVIANEFRQDLLNEGITPNPEHGFSFSFMDLPAGTYLLHVYAVDYDSGSLSLLSGSPILVYTESIISQISNTAGPSEITITTTDRLAGAIHSLTWNGKEFIDSYDHGRQLQSACHFDGFGECYNPTEAGSSANGAGPTSSSVLINYSSTDHSLSTESKMAFWLSPGDTAWCGPVMNTTETSDFIHTKDVTIGYNNMPHVIEYLVSYTIPDSADVYHGIFEAVTGYMPIDFSSFWTYNPETHLLDTLSVGPGEQPIPVILSTPDSAFVMGVYTPDLPDEAFSNAGYGRWMFDWADVVKWNAVFRRNDVQEGTTYSFRTFVLVGNLQNVMDAMDELYSQFLSSIISKPAVPTTFELFSNYPNPFNGATTFTYKIDISSPIELIIFSLNGDQIQRWTEPFQSPGTYSIKWMPENKSSGIYFYQLKVGNKVETNKCIFLK